MHYTVPVYLTELCVPVSIHQGRANLRSATHGDLSVAANKAQPMVAVALLYPVPQLGTRYRCRSVNNVSVLDSFAVISKRNYLIEHIMVLN